MSKITLEFLRTHIDTLDKEILKLLGDRMKISKKIGKIKRIQNLPRLQKQRWQEVLQDRVCEGQKSGLRETFIQRIWETIHQESLRQQGDGKTY